MLFDGALGRFRQRSAASGQFIQLSTLPTPESRQVSAVVVQCSIPIRMPLVQIPSLSFFSSLSFIHLVKARLGFSELNEATAFEVTGLPIGEPADVGDLTAILEEIIHRFLRHLKS
jgi:hypothetical protein